MPQYDELLEDDPESQAFDADLEPTGFTPPSNEHEAGVVIEEPSIIHIGRDKRKRELRKLQEESSDPERGNSE